MRRVLMVSLLGSLLAVLLAPALLGQAALQSQKGQLRVLRSGQPIGTERYEIIATATEVQSRGELEITVDDVSFRQSSTLLLSADLMPRQYELKMEEPEKSWRRVEFSAGKATMRYPLAQGKEDVQEFVFGSDRVAVLGLYHEFALLARLYDASQGGAQTLRVFVPATGQPGVATVEMKRVETREVDGQPVPVREFSVTTEDSQLQLWITESGRLVRLLAPLENIEVVAEPVS